MNFSSEHIDRESQRIVGNTKSNFDLQVMSFATLNQKEFPQQEWLVDDLIPYNARIVFSGQPESYKSFVAQAMAIAISEGQMLFGRYPTHQARVLIIDLENHEQTVQHRMRLLDAPETKNLLFSFNPDFSLQKPQCVEAVIQLIKQYSVQLVILDSLIRMHTALEDSSVEMARVTKAISHISDTGATVIFIHHDKKNDFKNQTPQSLRGSSEIRAAVDLQYGFRSDGNAVIMQQLKNRLRQKISPITLSVVEHNKHLNFVCQGGEIARKEPADDQFEAMVREVLLGEGGLNYTALLQKLMNSGLSKHKAEETITKLKNSNALQIVSTGNKNEKIYTLLNTPNIPNSLDAGALGVLPTSGEEPSAIIDEAGVL